MKKWKLLFLIIMCCMFTACSGSSSDSVLPSLPINDEPNFFVRFIDVGQGDSALVCCDGHYMLIDGGPEKAGNTVKAVLEEYSVRHLDYLIISHMHEDHIGGLREALTRINRIDTTLSNVERIMKIQSSKEDEEDEPKNSGIYEEVERQFINSGGHITVPLVGATYKLGKAKIEVIACESLKSNDSLVILVTYKNTRFLFTGDMQKNMEKELYDKYNKRFPVPVSLLKVPHHGATTSTIPWLVTMLGNSEKPRYAIISVGRNTYNHPRKEVIDALKLKKWKVYTTEEIGDITVTSDGNNLSVEPDIETKK